MAPREDLIASAVTFLQDPSVSASPLENRIAFLTSKNLTQEEIDLALARAGGEQAPANYSNYAPQQQVMRQPQSGYGGYQQYPWQPQAPPEVPKRDWRDWFIMATVMGGVSYGLYVVAKRYVIPLIAPPTPPQIEQDKASIDASFDKAFTLLDQLATDTEALKESEAARTERLDTALTEVETVIGELKSASRRREEESQRINSEVRGLKDLIPKAMDGQKESMDNRLKELNEELKSLKKLMGQRMAPSATLPPLASSAAYHQAKTAPQVSGHSPSSSSVNGTSVATSADTPTLPKPASVITPGGSENVAAVNQRSPYPASAGIPAGRSAIPAWQRVSSPAPASGGDSPSATQDGSGVA